MQLFANNAYGSLASGISDAATSFVLATGQGARFPNPTNGDYFLITLVAIDGGGAESAWEIVQVTARSTDTLTVVRAQEGTTGATWPAGTRIELRLTAGATESKANLGTAAYTASTAYAPATQGVTNGNSHDHNGGDGAQIAYSSLSGTPTLGDSASKNVGTTAGTVAAGDHNHASLYQPLDSDLTALVGLSDTGLIERTGDGTAGIVTITTAGKAILDDVDAATQRTTLGLGTGNSPQFTEVNIGHASDTTLARVSEGVISVEGVTVATASNTLTLTNKTLTGLKETKVAVSAAEIDLATGNYFTKTISTTTAFTVTNVPSAETAVSFILDLTNGGSATVSWSTGFTSVKYAGGTAPTLTASGRDVLGFFTHDGGTTWTCLLLGKDVK